MKCSNPACRNELGKWRMSPPKEYPEPKPLFCTKDPKQQWSCYDAFFAHLANKAKLYKALKIPMPEPKTHPYVLMGAAT